MILAVGTNARASGQLTIWSVGSGERFAAAFSDWTGADRCRDKFGPTPLRSSVTDAIVAAMSDTTARRPISGNGSRATIDDVAKLAGVSRTSVSRVLNNGPNVRPSLRAQVLRAVEELDFKVNIQARNLAGRTSGQIALVHQSDLDTEPNSYYHAALELGALRACAQHGFQLVTRTVSPDVETAKRQIRSMFDDRWVDGVIVTPPLSDEYALDQADGSELQIVRVAGTFDPSPLSPSIGIDDFAAGLDLTRHLLGLGHRRFGYIHGLAGHISAERRFAGLKAALAEAGLSDADIIEEHGTFTFHSGIECAQRMINRTVRPTALVCANDDMAAGALLAIHRTGLSIPEDISVTGFDDTPLSAIVWPPLTTVHQPIKQIGHDAAELLIALIGQDPQSADAPRQVTAPHHLVSRDSTGVPPIF